MFLHIFVSRKYIEELLPNTYIYIDIDIDTIRTN